MVCPLPVCQSTETFPGLSRDAAPGYKNVSEGDFIANYASLAKMAFCRIDYLKIK
jgi:hypothetical protein